jgi:hypothetical protein
MVDLLSFIKVMKLVGLISHVDEWLVVIQPITWEILKKD